MKQVERYETVIVGGGQAGLSVGLPPEAAGALVRHPRCERADRRLVAQPLGLAPALLAGVSRRAAGNAVPGTAHRPTRRRTRWAITSRRTRRASSFPVRSGDRGRRADEGERPLRRERRRRALRGRQRRRRHGRLQEAVHARVRGRARFEHHPASLQRLPQPVAAAGGAGARRRRSHSGSDIAYEASASHDVILSGTDTGQIPVPIESRRGRIGFRVLVFVGTHVLNVDTPMGRKMRPHIRHGGGPLLRYRKKDLLGGGSRARRSRERSASSAAFPCSTTVASSTCATSSGAPASGPTSAGFAFPSRSATTAIRCSTEAPPRRHPASTSQDCRSCTRSRRCSSPAARETPSGSRATSLKERAPQLEASSRTRSRSQPHRDGGRARLERPRRERRPHEARSVRCGKTQQ